MASSRIRDLVSVAAHPTVVRLDTLGTAGAEWIEESYCLTEDVRGHLRALESAFSGSTGKGIFVIGQFGSGKTHLLAWIISRLRAGDFVARGPSVEFVSLVNFSAAMRLEDIVVGALGLRTGPGDRRKVFAELGTRFEQGLVLVLDELSEFLRSKADRRAFNEDIRFLQFLGEWATGGRFWVVGALQESIERTGDIEYDLYRKIKDRFPLRLILSPAHIRDLIADGVLKKREGYEARVAEVVRRLQASVPPAVHVDAELLQAIYPVHPATLTLLEEVRDRFSQARGVIDFAVTQLKGDEQRGVMPFLDRPVGDLLTPDVIIDHYRDLLAIQPEFLPLSDKVFPYYDQEMGRLFEKKTLRALGGRLLKLLAVVFLSRSREGITPSEATYWLGFFAVRIAPEKNVKVVSDALEKLAREGRYVREEKGRYALHTAEDSAGAFSTLLARELSELEGPKEAIFDELFALLPDRGFNPLALPRDTWQPRDVEWHHHPRRCFFYLGNDEPEPRDGVTLVIRLPFGSAEPSEHHATVIPSRLSLTDAMREAVAAARLAARPLDAAVAKRAEKWLDDRVALVRHELASAFRQTNRYGPGARSDFTTATGNVLSTEEWLQENFRWVLRRTFSAFERFAPVSGPLPLEAYRAFLRFTRENDVEVMSSDPQVDLVRETYLVPMKLLARGPKGYRVPQNLEKHELIQLLEPVLQHGPTPETVYNHLAEPIYGLVPDQIHAFLVFLYTQGVIDIVKGKRSMGELYETLPTPSKYDRIEKGGSLDPFQARALEQLSGTLGVKPAAAGTVLSQRQAASRAAIAARARTEPLALLAVNLEPVDGTAELVRRIRRLLEWTQTLTRSDEPLAGFLRMLDDAGSIERFIDELNALLPLPDRLNRLMNERDRLVHLMTGLPHRVPLDPDGAVMLEAVGSPPGLDAVEALERWVARAARAYEVYARTYRDCHDAKYGEIARHPGLSWQMPSAAEVRQVCLSETLERYRALRRKVDEQLCRRMSNLAYQSTCACGFDGARAPVEETLHSLAEAEARIEAATASFFAKQEVREKVAAFRAARNDRSPGLRDYLDGAREVPEISDIEALEKHLAGVDTVVTIPLEKLSGALAGRTFTRRQLHETVAGLIPPASEGPFRIQELPDGGMEGIARWCVAQTLATGTPLPDGFSPATLAAATETLDPAAISPPALSSLDALGLPQKSVDHVLKRVIDGALDAPPGDERSPLVSAVIHMVRGSFPRAVQEYASRLALYYGLTKRMRGIAEAEWLAWLNRCAAWDALSSLPDIVECLEPHQDATWVVVDALGLAFTGAVRDALEDFLPNWRLEGAPAFARLGAASTTTRGFYDRLAAAGVQHPLTKIDCVDRILHERQAPFEELTKLALAELGIAFAARRAELDPSRPVLVFADHGFRLSRDGKNLVHGGDSPLEAAVPLFHLVPRGAGS